MTAPRRLSFAIVLSGLVGLASCEHGAPFVPPRYDEDEPLGGGARLTTNAGVDRDPSWLPDGSGILYSTDRTDRDDGDRCLVLLPPTGGRIRQVICNNTWAAGDSLNTFDAAAVSAAGQVAFVRSSRLIGGAGSARVELAAGPLDAIASAQALQLLPFTAGGVLHITVAQVRWTAPDAIVYRGDLAGNVCVNASVPCARVFARSGLNLLTQPANGSAPPSVLAGAELASSVSVDPGGDAIFYTLLGDDRVYRRVLSTGVTTVFYSMPGTIVRGVQVSGSKMLVVTGGAVTVLDPALNPSSPPIQLDNGGDLTVVDLVSGIIQVVSPPGMALSNPALSPDGSKVVAESAGDLWLFVVP